MHLRIARRSLGVALVAALCLGGVAFADTVAGDADVVAGGVQASRNLGNVFQGAHLSVDVTFELRCRGLQHVDVGQTVSLLPSTITAPEDGSATATIGSIGPLPAGWPADGQGCSGNPPLPASTPSTISLVAPTVLGTHTFSVFYDRSLSPAGSADDLATTGSTAVDLVLTVIPNTPPTLVLPGNVTLEGNEPGGASAAYTVSATDAEDDPDPIPTCSPAPGTHLPLGTTAVTCTVTDLGGLGATGSFTITVVDTIAPALAGVPSGLAADTSDPGGATVSWPSPTATDVVDPSPAVGCAPASGSTFGVGTTQVTCTARDASGNAASQGFEVVVTFVEPLPPPPPPPPPPGSKTVEVRFDAPVSGRGPVVVGRDRWPGRILPVKLELWSNEAEIRSGTVTLALGDLDRCGPGGSMTSAVVSQGVFRWSDPAGRWVLRLRVAGLAPGCHRAVVLYDGGAAGTFDLRVRR